MKVFGDTTHNINENSLSVYVQLCTYIVVDAFRVTYPGYILNIVCETQMLKVYSFI